MKLGFVSAILPDLSFEEVFNFAAKVGFDCVEVMCWPVGKSDRRYAGVTHIDVDNYQLDDIKEVTSRTGIEISALGYYPNPLTPNTNEAKVASAHIVKVIDVASDIGVNVNSFVGRDWTKSVEDNWDLFLQIWRPLVEHAEMKNVRIGIENCPMFFTKDEWPGGKNLAFSPAIWDRIFKDIPSENFGLNFDPSHFIWMQMDYLEAIKNHHSRFHHVHAKDVRMDWDKLSQVGILAHPNEYHTPKLPGLGDVDWGQFFSLLSDTGYDGAVCVEVEDRAYEGSLENRKRALIQSHDYLRQFIPRRL